MAIEMIRLAGRLHVLDEPLELVVTGGATRLAGGRTRIERSDGVERGVLELGDETWILLRGLSATERELRPGIPLTGLVGTFVSPPGGAFVREVVGLLLTDDRAILSAFAEEPATTIPLGFPASGSSPSMGQGDSGPARGVRLLPRLVRGTAPIRARTVDDAGDESTVELASRRIGDDLAVVWVEDAPDRVRRLTVDEASALEPDPEARFARALANLASLPLVRIVGDGPVYSVRRSGYHEAAFLLLDELWDLVDPLLDGPRLVAMPHHHRVWVTGDASDERRLALRRRLDRALELAEAPVLSRDLHRFDPASGAWEVVD